MKININLDGTSLKSSLEGNSVDIQKTYLLDKLKANIDNIKIIYMIFDAVVNCLGNHIYEFVECLLSLTSDIKVFSRMAPYSRIPNHGVEVKFLYFKLN